MSVVESPYLQRIMERRTAAAAAVAAATVSTAEGPPFPSSYPPIEGSSMVLGLGAGPGATNTNSREQRTFSP